MKNSTRNAFGLAILLAFLLALLACASNSRATAIVIEAPTDKTAPVVMSVSPANGDVAVALDTAVIINFSEPVDQNTVTTNSVKLLKNGSQVLCTVKTENSSVTLIPSEALDYGIPYVGLVTTLVKDLAGNALKSDYSWSFTTRAPLDITYPVVTGTSPSANTTNIPVTTQVVVFFNRPIATTTGAFKLFAGNTEVAGSVSLDLTGTVLTFVPASSLAYATAYTGVITTAIRDLAGNVLQQEYRWSFTTVDAPFTPFVLDAMYHIVNVANDESGNVYVYGYFNPPSTPTDSDIFVARFDANGKYHWMKTIHTEVTDWPQGGIVAARGYVYIQRVRDPIGSGSADIFVDKLTGDEGIAVWSVSVDSGVMPSSVSIDEADNLYATNVRGTVKLDTNGSILRRSNNGGATSAYAWNGLFVAGTTYQETTQLTDRYLTRMDTNFSTLWTEWLHNNRNTDVRGIAISKNDSVVCVAEDSFTTSPTVQFYPFVSGYQYKVLGGVGVVSVVWTRSLSGGRISTTCGGAKNSVYVTNNTPSTLTRLRSLDGSTVWSIPLAKDGMGVIEFNDSLIYVADGTNTLAVYDAQTGTKKF